MKNLHRRLVAVLAMSGLFLPGLYGQDAPASPKAGGPAMMELLSVQGAGVSQEKDATTVVVTVGEDIFTLALRLLGDDSLWTLVWQFNRDQLESPDGVRDGMRLKIPPFLRRGPGSTPGTGTVPGTTAGTPPAARTDPVNVDATRKGGITTRSPGFDGWFREAADAARKSWNMPRVTNRYGRVITEEDYLKAILFIESRGVHRLANGRIQASGAGARGFMQLMPATARGLGVNPDDPRQNLIGGARYLGQCFASRAMGNPGDAPADRLAKAAAGYNTGPARRSLVTQTWDGFVRNGIPETVYYGIQLKMALGLDLSPTEESWVSRHKGVSPSNVDSLAADIYARSQGIVNA